MGRPEKYANLGPMDTRIRVPNSLLPHFEKLFTELDRLDDVERGEKLLSDLANTLSDYVPEDPETDLDVKNIVSHDEGE